jgi:hypothetical protein
VYSAFPQERRYGWRRPEGKWAPTFPTRGTD